MTNAEYQGRWRNKRNALAKEALRLHAEPAKPTQKYDDLAKKLDPLFDAIFRMVPRGSGATYRPPINELLRIERALVAAGIMPASRRTDDAVAYARECKREQGRLYRLPQDLAQGSLWRLLDRLTLRECLQRPIKREETPAIHSSDRRRLLAFLLW